MRRGTIRPLNSSYEAIRLLVVKFANGDQLDPNREEYDRFMKAWGEVNRDGTREITKNDPSMREITGECRVRAIRMT